MKRRVISIPCQCDLQQEISLWYLTSKSAKMVYRSGVSGVVEITDLHYLSQFEFQRLKTPCQAFFAGRGGLHQTPIVANHRRRLNFPML